MKKKISGLVSLLLIAVMLVTAVGPVRVAEAADKPAFVLKTSSSTVKPGDTIEAELWLQPDSNLTSFVLNFTYDEEIFENLISFSRGGGIKGDVMNYASMTNVTPDPGSISLMVDFDEYPDVDGGLVFTLQLKVKDSASGIGNIGVDFKQGTVSNGASEVKIMTEDVAVSETDKDGNVNNGNITINIELQSITLNKTEDFTMARGSEETLSVTGTPANALAGKIINWTSSNPEAVTIDASGKLSAVGIGTSVITAEADGKSASVTVNVNAPLNAISLNKETLTLRKGTSNTLTVSYDPADTTDGKTITWTSSDPSVATVDANGKVTALKAGTVQIAVSVGDKTAACVVNVKEEPLKGISLSEEIVSVAKNDSTKLTVSYDPADTTDDKTVVWSSEDEEIAVVKDGVVTGKKAGTTTIKAVVGKYEAVCEVTVTVPLEELKLNYITLSLLKNQMETLIVTFNPEDTTDSKEVTWSIDHPEIVEIISNGDKFSVKGKKAGQALITVKGVNNTVATCIVDVKEIGIAGIVIEPTEKTLEIGETTTCKVTYTPADTTDDKVVAWSSSNENVAVVDNGIVTAVAGGTAVITAETANGKKAECVITVPIHMTEIVLQDVTVLKNETKPLAVTYIPENTTDDRTVVWSSDNESVAVVDADGNVTGISAGTAVITAATTVGNLTAQSTVTVEEIALEGIEISSENPTELLKGESTALKVNLIPANTTDNVELIYTSSDEEVVTVDTDGTIYALKEGTAEIFVETADKAYSTGYTVTVKEIPLEGITFDKTVETLEAGQTVQVNVVFTPENTTDDKAVVWSSSDEKVATAEGGLIKAVKAGKTTITAAVGEKTISFELTVTEKKVTDNKDQNKDNKDNKTENSKVNTSSKSGGAVKTGDETNILFSAVMVILSLSVIMSFMFRRKRTHR